MQTHPWAHDAVFYHLFPLGLCGAPRENQGHGPPVSRLRRLLPWLEHAADLGATAVLLGPVTASSTHGYDTVDLRRVDRRLGTSEDLKELVERAHDLGLRVVLDAVFNHVGREHWAFQDLQRRGAESDYAAWFAGLDFQRRSPLGDAFRYETWDGHWELAKLDTGHKAVREHLIGIAEDWVRELGIDGLRLDAADVLHRGFQRRLARRLRRLRSDVWLLGEVVHGDYSRFAAPDRLDSVTNFELYKGLWSSHVDRNFFELAHALERQRGLYGDLQLYTFADNHDVARVASKLRHPRQLRTLYLLLFTMPGIPSIYYGSEWGLRARKDPRHDWDLRPALELGERGPDPEIEQTIRTLTGIRHSQPALRQGGYRTLHVSSEQLVFARTHEQPVVVAVNAADDVAEVAVDLGLLGQEVRDLLTGETFSTGPGSLELPRSWGRILVRA